MPTIWEKDGLKFKVNANDHNPPHVHVEGYGATVRINLLTLEVMDAETAFSRAAVKRILEICKRRQIEFMESWNEYHE